MKSKIFLFIGLLVLAGILIPESPKTGLVSNGNFTAGSQDWVFDEGIDYTWFGGKGYSFGLKMDARYKENKPYSYNAAAKQCISLESNNAEFFEIEADVKLKTIPRALTAHRINIYWFRDNYCSSGGQFGMYLEPKAKTGWQHVKSRPLARAMGAKSVLVEVNQSRGSTSVAVNASSNNANELVAAHWDNIHLYSIRKKTEVVALRAVKEGLENYIQNGNFSEDEHWEQSKYRVITEYVDFEGKDNSRAMKSVITHDKDSGLGTGASDQCVNLPKDRIYELGISYRVAEDSTQNGGGRLRPTWYQYQNCKGPAQSSGKHADVVDSYNWVDLKVKDLVAPPTAQSVKVVLIQSIKGKGEFSIIWDDAYLRVSED